jgi:hypothetical protein
VVYVSPIHPKKNAAHPKQDGGAREADLMWDPVDLGANPSPTRTGSVCRVQSLGAKAADQAARERRQKLNKSRQVQSNNKHNNQSRRPSGVLQQRHIRALRNGFEYLERCHGDLRICCTFVLTLLTPSKELYENICEQKGT